MKKLLILAVLASFFCWTPASAAVPQPKPYGRHHGQGANPHVRGGAKTRESFIAIVRAKGPAYFANALRKGQHTPLMQQAIRDSGLSARDYIEAASASLYRQVLAGNFLKKTHKPGDRIYALTEGGGGMTYDRYWLFDPNNPIDREWASYWQIAGRVNDSSAICLGSILQCANVEYLELLGFLNPKTPPTPPPEYQAPPYMPYAPPTPEKITFIGRPSGMSVNSQAQLPAPINYVPRPDVNNSNTQSQMQSQRQGRGGHSGPTTVTIHGASGQWAATQTQSGAQAQTGGGGTVAQALQQSLGVAGQITMPDITIVVPGR